MSKIYHGTSQHRYEQMLKDGFIVPAPIGEPHVSFSTERKVAEYFAHISANWSDDPVTKRAILVFDTEQLEADGFTLHPFSSPVWGEGECDWECEIVSMYKIPISYATRIDGDEYNYPSLKGKAEDARI